MKIMHVITSLDCGGAQQQLYDFLTASTYGDEHIVIYFKPGQYVQKIKDLGITLYYAQGIFFKRDPWCLVRLYFFIKKNKPHLIHSSLWLASLFSRLIGYALGIPVVCDMHGSHRYHGVFRNWSDRLTAHIPVRHIAVATGVKHSFYHEILAKISDQRTVHAILNRVEIIFNGVDPERVRSDALADPFYRTDWGIDVDEFVIGSLGRLTSLKSYDSMIQAFARIHTEFKSKLVVVGGGPQEEFLKNMASQLGIAHAVIFTGMRSDARRFFPLFDCFALSSQSEGLSIAILEALCFGLPVITTNPEGYHDLITHKEHGLLVPVGGIEELAEAFRTVFYNRSYAHIMGQKGRCLVESQFSLSSMVGAYERVYKECVKKKDGTTKN